MPVLLALLFALPAHALSPAPGNSCAFGAFVNETDPKGLNVRAEPSATAKILGTLPPIAKSADDPMTVMAEVEVTAASRGWFKIRNARENETLLENLEIKPRKIFAGEGWVSGTKLTIKSMASQAYASPGAKKPVTTAGEGDFDEIGRFSLLDCNGAWVQVKDGRPGGPQKFWLNKICSIQETSCSPGGLE